MFRVIFLGTGCMVPTKDRNHISIAIEYKDKIFLFDCGEGTQRQIKIAGLPLGKIRKIFISHWHGDHVLGLPGLIQTLNSVEVIDKIDVYGPRRSTKFLSSLLRGSVFELTKELEVHEVIGKKEETIYENEDIVIEAISLKHSIPVLGYVLREKDKINIYKEKLKEAGLENSPLLKNFKEGRDIRVGNKIYHWRDFCYIKKGKKIAIILDTVPDENLIKFVENSDILIMEATFLDKVHRDKAEKTLHMTARGAAEIAQVANVDKLILTHFSQRYKDIKELEDEAKLYFNNVVMSYDFMKIKIR